MSSMPGYAGHVRSDRLSRDTSISSDTSELSTFSTTDSEMPLFPQKYDPSPPTQQDSWKKYQRRRFQCICVMVGLALCFSLLTTALSVLICLGKIPIKTDSTEVTASFPKLCLPCQDLVLTPFPQQDESINQLDIHYEDKMICCANSPEQYTLFVQKLVNRKIAQEQALALRAQEKMQDNVVMKDENEVQRNVAAHLLMGLQRSEIRSSDGDFTLVQTWMKDRFPAFIQGLHLADDRVVIEHGGLYLIYSQVYFKVKVTSPSPDPSHLGHRVYRYSVTIPNGGKDELLQSSQSCCDGGTRNRTRVYFHTSSVVGVFRLESRDEIYVTVSHPRLIYRDPTRSYIGLYKLQ